MLVIFLITTTPCLIGAVPVFAASAVGNSWAEKTPMNYARSALGVAVVNGKIYAIGGNNQEAFGGSELAPAQSFSGGIIGVNEEYNPSTNNWTVKAPMPTARMNFAIAAYQGKIYCIGGNDNYNSWVGVNEVYNPSTNSWATKAPMPTPRSGLQANVVDGKIYCIGGTDCNGQYSAVNEVYDPATNSWSTRSPLPCQTGGYVSDVFDGEIYVIGGYDEYAYVNLNQIYNPQNDSWSYGAPPPGYIGPGAGTIGVMAPERIYSFGDSTHIYDPENNSWSLGSSLPRGGGDFVVANVDDQLYVIGGDTFTGDLNGDIASETELALNQQYTPVGYGTPDPAYLLQHSPPSISLLSPLNQTYRTSSIPLLFGLNKQVSWMSYTLDGKQNVTTVGNTTLTGLTNGLHKITIYANDTYGNVGTSETITFTIAKPAAFPTATVAAVSAGAVVAAVAVLLVYSKKHKR